MTEKRKVESKELVKKENAQAVMYDSLRDEIKVSSQDLLIPKICLMQGLSKLVAEEKAKMGELRDSVDGKLLGTELEVILFNPFKTWVIFEELNSKLEYKQILPMTPSNEGWLWEENVNGVKVKRDKSLNYFALLPSEIKDGLFFPYSISFRRTSYIAGKKIETSRAKLEMFGRPLSARVFKLSKLKQQNDKGTFYIFDVSEGRMAEPAELEAVAKWKKLMQTTALTIDDSDLHDEKNASIVPSDDERMF